MLNSKNKVLDAGCAAGRDTNKLTKLGLDVVEVDISDELLKIAKRKYPNIKFRKADFRKLPFKDNSFYGIWANASLLHLETIDDVKKSLLEFNRVLKPNGLIHILVKAQTGGAKTAIVKDDLSKHNRFFQYFTKGEIEKLLKDCHYRIVKISQYKETDKDPNGRPEVEWILALVITLNPSISFRARLSACKAT